MNATVPQSLPAPPDPAFLLPPHLVTALNRLDSEMDRRTRNYDALEPQYRLKRVETDIRLFGRLASARKTILDAHLSLAKTSSHPSHQSDPSSYTSYPSHPSYSSDAAGIATAKPSGEAGPSTPSTIIPLPDPAQYLPKMMLDGLLRAETALADLIAHWPEPSLCQDYASRRRAERRAHSSILYDREFEDAVRHLCRAIGIRKSVFDLAHGYGPPPEGFIGWDSDTDRNPFDDPEPPIPPPDCPPPPSPADIISALRTAGSSTPSAPTTDPDGTARRSFGERGLSTASTRSTSSTEDLPSHRPCEPDAASYPSHGPHPSPSSEGVATSKPPAEAGPAIRSSRSLLSLQSFSSLSLRDPFPRVRALHSYCAIPKKIFRFLRRFGSFGRFFVYIRPWFKNPPVRKLSSAVGRFVADFDPELAYPPDDPGDSVAFAPT